MSFFPTVRSPPHIFPSINFATFTLLILLHVVIFAARKAIKFARQRTVYRHHRNQLHFYPQCHPT